MTTLSLRAPATFLVCFDRVFPLTSVYYPCSPFVLLLPVTAGWMSHRFLGYTVYHTFALLH